MNRINLLPESVVSRQRRVRTARAAAVLAVAAVTVGTVWGAVAYGSARELSRQLDVAQARLDQEQQRAGKLATVTAEATAIRALLAQGDRLSDPVALPGVLNLLTHLLPESVALTRLVVEPPPPEALDRPKQAPKGPPPPRTTRMLLEGLATGDLELARVVSELSGQKAFANVKLLRSRPVTSGGRTRYAFELTADVPPAISAEPVAAAATEKGDHGR